MDLKEKGVSDEALGKAAGIDASMVGQIMRGEIERPPDKRLAGFAKALGVPTSMLTSMVEKEDPGSGKPDPKPKGGDKMEVFKEDGSLNTEAIPAESRPFAEAIFKQFSAIKTHNETITKENATNRPRNSSRRQPTTSNTLAIPRRLGPF